MSLWGHQIPWESGILLWNRDSHMKAFDPHRFQRDWFTRKRSLVTMGCKQRLHYWTPVSLSGIPEYLTTDKKSITLVYSFHFYNLNEIEIKCLWLLLHVCYSSTTAWSNNNKKRTSTSMCSTPVSVSVCQLRKSHAPLTLAFTFGLIEIALTGLIYCARQI